MKGADKKFCQLWLTCKDKRETDEIADTLLVKHLVACVKQMPVSSAAWWQGKIENSDEVLLMMESREDLFEEIEREVNQLHSYNTPVLTSTSLNKLSKKTATWLKQELK